MKDDALIEELARVARDEEEAERDRLGGRGAALVAGQLTAEEEAELRALAEGSEHQAAAFEALRPLGDGFKQRVTAAIEAELADDRPAAEVVSLDAVRRRRRPAPGWWLPATALAAASVALVLWPGGTPGPLPVYELELAGSVRTQRSAPPAAGGEVAVEERRLLAPGNRLRLVLRPSVAVEGPVAFAAFVSTGGAVSPLRWPETSISEDGAVLAQGTVLVDGGLALPAGDSTLLLAVGRAGQLPDGAELERRLAAGSHHEDEAWAAWAVPVRLETAAPE